MEDTATLETPLGRIRFVAHAKPHMNSACELRLRVVEPSVSLPPGMSVNRTRAVVLRVRAQAGLESLSFCCQVCADIAGEPESGEHLDAQSFETQADRVLVGTEDCEALSSRMPALCLEKEVCKPVRYLKDGFRIQLENIPAGLSVGLHFLVAENSNPEPVDCSAWYAVHTTHAIRKEHAS